MDVTVLNYGAVVVGTGAAGYNAACILKENGINAAIITEKVNSGTSRNAGSDKQTYYKLSLAGDIPDSPRDMAKDLFDCGSADGDNALCEAAHSSGCFLRLASLGVEFPYGQYGEYVGYKTDHDPRARASSAGPLTSKRMTEVLQKEAKRLKIPVLDGFYAAEIITDENSVRGVLCIHKNNPVIIKTDYVILATGGPAGIYSRSVYPKSQHGSTGLAVYAGAALQNITEWQFGLASVNPRWNVSGTYMQSMPKIIFRYPDGSEREICAETEKEKYGYMSLEFLKGYQWPFDSSKAEKGSSVIDMIVEKEIDENNCRVFLDFRNNPYSIENIDYSKLSEEAENYLSSLDACFGRPIDRLKKMNMPAYEFYLDYGIDLEKDMLEISECVQHCNGGIAVDSDWQTCVNGLFAAGECAGTHGVKRPGGSALNAGQVGSLRAALCIKQKLKCVSETAKTEKIYDEAIEKYLEFASGNGSDKNIKVLRKLMSANAGIVREKEKLEETVNFAKKCVKEAEIGVGRTAVEKYRNRNDAITALAVASAMLEYCKKYNVSRGSAYIAGEAASESEKEKILSELNGKITEVKYVNGEIEFNERAVRKIPEPEGAFEKVWSSFRTRNF